MAARNRKTRLAALEKTDPSPETLPDLQAPGQKTRSKDSMSEIAWSVNDRFPVEERCHRFVRTSRPLLADSAPSSRRDKSVTFAVVDWPHEWDMSSFNHSHQHEGLTLRQAELIAGFGYLLMPVTFAEFYIKPKLLISWQHRNNPHRISSHMAGSLVPRYSAT